MSGAGDAGSDHRDDEPRSDAGTAWRGAGHPHARWLLPVLLAIPLVAWLALASGLPTPLKGLVERQAGATLGRPVHIHGRLAVVLTPWGVDLSAHGVRVDSPAWAHDRSLLRVARFTAHRSMFDILTARPGFAAVSVDDGTLALERSADGKRTTWPDLSRDGMFDRSRVRVLTVDRVQVRYRDDRTGTAARLSLRAHGVGAFVLTGTVDVAGRRLGAAGEVRSSSAGSARLRLALWGGGDRFGLDGQATRPFDLARSRPYVFAAGRDVADLAGLAGLTLAPLGDYAFSGRASRSSGAWRFTHLAGRVGRTDLAGWLTLGRRDGRPRIVAQLSSRALHLGDAMLLFGVRHGLWPPPGTPDASAGIEEPPAAPRLLPDATFVPAALRATDVRVDYAAERLVGPARPAGPLSMRLAVRRGVLVISPGRVAMDGGFVSADIVVDTRRVPAIARYDVRLSPTPMARLLAPWGVAPAGTTAMARGRLLLTGRGMTVRETLANASGRIALVMPTGALRTRRVSDSALDLGNLAAAIFGEGETDTTAINCGVIAFTVHDGVGTSDPLLIDTAAHVLSGQGSIDLRDERLDLRLAAGSKRFSLFGRPHPVILGGALANPVATREPTPWLRPARLLGLEFSVPDLQALFRFVDPGDTRPAHCPTN